MTPQELKNSILQLAIQGKLVEQRAEEGTAAELLEKILAAKNAKSAKKNLTRSRGARGENKTSATSASPREKIPDDEKPFDIPESWEWVHINQVAETSLGKTMDKEKNTGDYYPYLCSINVYWDGISLEKVKEARFTVEDKEKYLLKKGDLLICEGGDVGRSAIWNFDKEMYYQNALHRVRFYEGVLPQYFRLMIECYKGLGIIERYCKGVTIKHLVQNSLYAIWFPLPPLAEQKRIVAKIEELLPLIDRYEKAWSRLEDFNKRFPVDMQKSLLQMAIQGKLVEQRAEEGTGEELLEKILAAKNAKSAKKNSRAESQSRREKKTSALSASLREKIPDDEKPFDIPESWEWVRLGEIGSWASGATPSRTHAEYFGGNIPWLKTGDLTDGYVSSTPETITELALAKTSVRLNPVGSVLMAMYGATIGKLGILKIAATTNQACCACIPHDGVWNKYLFYYLMARRKDFVKMGEGGAQPNISKEKIVNSIIPLPPLAEQKRIVAKLEELLPLCERLK